MNFFFDSSAIAKRYHQEPGSGWVWSICKSATRPVLYLSAIAEVELGVSLRRIARLEGLHHSWADAQENLFLRDMAREYQLILADAPNMRIARLLADHHSGVPTLRSLDAIQLACALWVQRTDPQVTFVAADARLATIARREGFAVIDPAHP